MRAEVDLVKRRVRAQPQRANHRHRPSLERIVILVAVKLEQVELESLQALLYIIARGVDEDPDQLRAPFDGPRNRRRRLQRQASRTRRIEVQPDQVGAEPDGEFGVLVRG